jgi:phosphoribosylformylglycinamidine synthase
MIRDGIIRSAHDCSEGGLAVNLAESCMGGNLGAKTSIPGTRADVALFNESQSRIVITVSPENAAKAEDFLKSRKVPHSRLGTVTADPTLSIQAAGKPFTWPLEKLRTPFEKTIPSMMSWEK